MTIEWVIIPAAGLGKRMRHVNPSLPKEMLPVGRWPVIHYSLKEALRAGIHKVALIISKRKEILRAYIEDPSVRRRFLEDPSEEETIQQLKVSFLYQSEPLGEADAIALAEDVVSGDAFGVVYPDNLHLPRQEALKTLVEAYSKTGTDVIGLMEVTKEVSYAVGNAGRVDIKPLRDELYEIKSVLPKGEGHFRLRFPKELRTCGFSIVERDIFDYIRRAREMVREGELTDVPVRMLMLQQKRLLGCRLPGRVFDVGNPTGYNHCVEYIQSWS
jgi:UTP--glucose-1-phosphate uridylyltransferase